LRGRRRDDQQIAAFLPHPASGIGSFLRLPLFDLGRTSEANLKRREFISHLAAVSASSWTALWAFVARGQTRGSQPAAAPSASDQPAGDIGQVATVKGSATVARGSGADPIPLRVKDPIFKNDTLATAVNSSLGITFDDQTTFNLSANTSIVIDEFIFHEGGSGSAAEFNVAVGTAAFVASLVAKTGDMKISTPSATLGIRGTTGVVNVPQGAAAAGAGAPTIKLYPDSDGHVGQIDVFDRQGGRLGSLTQGATAFTIQRGPSGGLRAVPYQIPPSEQTRDRGVLRRLSAVQDIGRRMTIDRMRARGANRPGSNRPGSNRPGPDNRQPGNHQPEHRQPGERQLERQQPGREHQPSNRNPRGGGPRGGGGRDKRR
jgi:hypothetical protein